MCVFAHTHKYSEQISPAGLSFPLKIIKFSIIIRGKCGNFFIFCGLLLALNSVFVRAGIGMNGVICMYVCYINEVDMLELFHPFDAVRLRTKYANFVNKNCAKLQKLEQKTNCNS